MSNKGNRWGYYQDGDGNGNDNGNYLRGKEVEQGGEWGNGRMGLFSFIAFIFDGGEENCFVLSYFVIVFFVSLFSMKVD